MPRPKVAKSKRPEAERAAENYLFHICGCDPFQIIRAVRTQWQREDLWASDVMGRDVDGRCFYAQATAGQNEAVRARRRKLERISWNLYDTVMVLQLVESQDPANNRRKQWWFRVHRYDHKQGVWGVDSEAAPVPKEWFRKLRIEEG